MKKNYVTPEILVNDIVSCEFATQCGGCDFIGSRYQDQIDFKTNDLKKILHENSLTHPEILFLSAGTHQLRDRLDFTLDQGRLGLYSKTDKQIVDLPNCQQLSPTLQSWLTEFRTFQWPFNKASFRLRINPQGERGLWIDAANTDIKILLDEKNTLLALQKICFVEIGQRRKVPTLEAGVYKLRDPEHRVWFQTTCGEKVIDLYCQIASFTQPSFKANKVLSQVIQEWVGRLQAPRILEFGSGIGNLSFPALANSTSLTACEIDELALKGFSLSLQNLDSEIADKVKIHRGDFQRKLTEDFRNFDLVLANPPRSGLQNFLEPLQQLAPDQRPQYFIYMSCFPETFAEDAAKLKGYQIQEISIVDQFPQSKHYEVLALFKRNEI